MSKATVGVIGGSGVYDLPGLTDLREERIATPWGDPSDSLRFGRVGETQAVFLARHGRGHRFSPSTINYRANIDALKRVGVTDIIALSACGSFHRDLYPGMFVMIDQFDDRTYRRQTSFLWRRLRRACLDGAPDRAAAATSPRRRGSSRRRSPAATGAPTSASKVRSFRRWRNRSAFRRAAPTSSA